MSTYYVHVEDALVEVSEDRLEFFIENVLCEKYPLITRVYSEEEKMDIIKSHLTK